MFGLRHWYYTKFISLERLEKKICLLGSPKLSVKGSKTLHDRISTGIMNRIRRRKILRGTVHRNKIKSLLEYRHMRLHDSFEWTPENIEAIKRVNDMLIKEIKAAIEHLQEHLKVDAAHVKVEDLDYEMYIEIEGFEEEHFP